MSLKSGRLISSASGVLGGVIVVVTAAATARDPTTPKPTRLLAIGATKNLVAASRQGELTIALVTLRGFIKSQTGFDNEITHQKDWMELAEKMANGQLQVGVFQGFEFAWAQNRYPGLKPLALAVNIYRYRTACVVVRHDDPATDFAGLRGQSLAIATGGNVYLQLYLDRECHASGERPEHFFSHPRVCDNAEDALDDAVDGTVQVVVVDRAALEAYKRRKPARFQHLKQVAHSQPFPPPIIAYHEQALSPSTLRRFRDGLLKANQQEKGQMLLTLFRLTGFERAPSDFSHVLADTSASYPPPAGTER